MRILFTFAGNRGHLDPLLPIARAALSRGHTVAFSGRPWMVPKVEALGFACFPAGIDEGLVPERRPLRPLDRGRAGPWGARKPRARIADLLPLCRAWRPDIVVWEDTDFAGALVAERLGIAHASVSVIAAGSFMRPEGVRPAIEELRGELGLPPDPGLGMLSRHLVLVPVPPSFRDPAVPPPATARFIRPAALEEAHDGAPDWVAALPARPTVYLSLGSVMPLESGDLFARAIGGIRELPLNLIVTVGDEFDRSELGPQPDHVRIEPWIPQAALLPRCDLVVSHGGSGSVIGALAHGLPLVVIPMDADQPQNAARCEALGVGLVLDPIAATQEDVRDAVRAVLGTATFRDAAIRVQRESASLPRSAHAVALLERLVTERSSPTLPSGPANRP
jgi:UDP:flavonoid glycosyltransferase YjiC (YdhE family)